MDVMEQMKNLKIGGEIERVDGRAISYIEFAERYLAKNQPVVLTGLMNDWRACKDWVCEGGSPNLRFFSTHFGNSRVQVADCDTKEFTDQKRVEMSVSEFIEQWILLSGGSFPTNATSDAGKSTLYLKDWHFVKEYPEYVAYKTPLFFRDDWLNLYVDHYKMQCDPDAKQKFKEISCSDYRFVYMGPKGTWTPLHADVFKSYSWSSNVCGAKLWLFLPPSQKHLVFDRYMKNSVYNIFEDVDENKFPGFKKTVWTKCKQRANEIIFVPSGWYHQVYNLEDTISINHNWFNGYNIHWVWDLLVQDYNEAKEYIEDIRDICDDFESLCQQNLAANTGMNFQDFFTFLTHMSFTFIAELFHLFQDCGSSLSTMDPLHRHIVFNLYSIKSIALKMKSICLDQNFGISSDFNRVVDDPTVLDLLIDLDGTYRSIYEESAANCGTRSSLPCDIRELGIPEAVKDCQWQSSPDGLIEFIESALVKLDVEGECLLEFFYVKFVNEYC